MKEKLLLCVLLVFSASTGFGQGDSDAALQRSADLEKLKGSENLTANYYGRPRLSLPVLPKELKEKLQITKGDKAEVESSLKFSKVKVFKLWNNLCRDSKVVNVNNEDCLKTSDYIKGSSYSFELKNYHHRYASISLIGGDFSVRNQSGSAQIIADMGTTNLEDIDEKNVEIVEISRFAMFDKNGYSAWKDETEKKEFNNLKLFHKLAAQPNHTYVLRSVFMDDIHLIRAYKETLVAFRLVKIENNIATILWKPVYSKWV